MFFDPEDGGSVFLQMVGNLLQENMAAGQHIQEIILTTTRISDFARYNLCL
jgi:hypothetical protein